MNNVERNNMAAAIAQRGNIGLAAAKIKKMTARQKDIIQSLNEYLGLNLSESSRYVKNAVINVEIDGMTQQQLHAIENYGRQFGKFRVAPGGYKQISLIITSDKTAK